MAHFTNLLNPHANACHELPHVGNLFVVWMVHYFNAMSCRHGTEKSGPASPHKAAKSIILPLNPEPSVGSLDLNQSFLS